ncbi:MAG: M48 family metallopeptidase [Desulfobacterales bacterium]|nr:M48 family metallopeptidase [Desulfobacterales bacterium]MDI6688080.1 M48 family metallopeptidase [Desulfobacterales bacterium]
MNYQVHFKENLYFTIKLIAAIVGYVAIAALLVFVASKGSAKLVAFVPIICYVGIFLLYLVFRHGILIGYLKGNAVRVSDNQFPALYGIAKTHAERLGLSRIPSIYVLQAGGLLNAFATRFFGKDFVVIYSDILETAYEQGNKALEFVVAHEFGHIKRRHSTKHVLLFPSFFVPFLNAAYSRACEYTCDRIGYALCPEGSTGMLVLAGGKNLHSKISVDAFLQNSQAERGFWRWFAEIVSSHPNLPKRISQLRHLSGRSGSQAQWESERSTNNG